MQKTKYLVLSVGMILLSFPISALDHSGTISVDETWYVGGSPHHITGDLTVANGITLTIQAGCTVKFNDNFQLQIQGTLIADGTSGSHITFTSNQGTPAAGDWQYIYFYGADAGCILDYCDISYGGSTDGNIRFYNSYGNVSITNCEIEHSGTAGFYITNNSYPSISDCLIQNNTNHGIYCPSSSAYPYITDCSILNNGSYAIATYANNVKEITGTMNITGNTYNSIYVYSATVYSGTWLYHNVPYVIGGDVTVNDSNILTINPECEIRFNGNYQLQVQGTLIADGTDSAHITFTSNLEPQAQGDWQYMYFSNADAGCILDYCDISYGGSTDGNIRFYNSYGNVSITNCEIEHSGTAGFYITNNSYPTISDCLIQNNNTHGIYCTTSSAYPYISDCTMQANGSYAIHSYTNSLKEITGTMTISGNTYDEILAYGATVYTGTWLDHDVPYVIVSDFSVDDGDTLTISAGTEIKFHGNITTTVYGAMVADGTDSEHITFTSNAGTPSPGDWRYINFSSSEPGCLLDYCDFSYGGSLDGNIRLQNTDTFTISNCSFTNSGTSGLYIHDNSQPVIFNSTFSNNTYSGIKSNSSSAYPFISDCTIQNNGNYAIRSFTNNLKEITGTINISGNTHDAICAYGATVYTGTWLDHDVPYVIVSDFSVDDGDTLTISPGTEIKFHGNITTTVYGALVADGTDSEHITFTSNLEPQTPGDWRYIHFYATEPDCLLDYCDFSYGGSSDGNIRLQNTNTVTISNCSFTNSGTAGLYIRENSQPVISNSSFSDNITHGIYVYSSNGYPYISDCTMQTNGSYAIHSYTNSLKEITGTMTISGNTYDEILAYGATVYTGTWLDHNVPYIIGGDFSVDDGDTLTISAGTEIEFNGNRTMTVYGALVADGTDSEHITFTSNLEPQTPGDWRYIHFYATEPDCLLDYCDFSYGGSSDGNIRLQNTNTVTISNCSFTNSGTAGLYIRENSQPVISNSSFSDNITHGIYVYSSNGYPYISDCTMQTNGSYAIHSYTNSLKEITGAMTISGNTYDAIFAYGATVYTGTWLDHNVPYVIGGDFTVDDGDTLTISQGTEIKFSGNRIMTVSGALVADGTDSEHITFTSNAGTPSPGDWRYINFSSSEPGCLLDYCDFSYGGYSDGIIRLQNTNTVTISNCSSTYSGTAGLYIYDNSQPVISNSSFSNNTTYGIHSHHSSGYPYISDCTILNNGSYAIVTFGDNVKAITGTMVITGNTYNSIYVGAETVYTGTWLNHNVPYDISGTFSIPDGNTLTIAAGDTLRFKGNYNITINGTLTAIGTSDEHITITRSPTYAGYWSFLYFYNPDDVCRLTYCDLSYGGNTEGMVYARGAGTNLELDNCRIKYSNTNGISLRDGSHPSIINCLITNNTDYGINVAVGINTPTFGSNSLEWNDIFNNGIYDLVNGSADLDAKYVFWGFTDYDDIEDRIFHEPDDPGRGFVDFDPWENAAHSELPANEHAGLIDAGSPYEQRNWTYANGSIHYVTGAVTVDNGTTVTIEDGVEVRCTEGTYIAVNGELVADGTPDPITFTRHGESVDWRGIWFNSSSTGTLDNCTIEYVTYADGYGIYTETTSPQITNCTVQNSNYGLYCDIYVPATLTNNNFQNNTTGIYVQDASSPNFSSTNTTQNNDTGFHFLDCSSVNISNQNILNNTGTYGAIYMETCHEFDLGEGNTITGNSYPLTINIASYASSGSAGPTSGNTNNAIQVYGGTTASNFYWYDFGIPYIVTADPTIDVGDLLEISAGVDVRFENARKMDILGTLNANGVFGDLVIFTRNDSTDAWKGLIFDINSTGNFDYCRIEYATYGTGYGIYADSSAVNLDKCILQYNNYGYYGNNDQPALTYNTFSENTYGIYFQNTANPNLNIGTENVISDNSSCGIYYKDCSSLGTIENFTLQNNEGNGAFLISNSADFVIGTNTISGNNWPLSIDCGSFPDIGSNIPTSGNTNNDIKVTSGTGTKTGTWHNFMDLNYIISGIPVLGTTGNLTIVEGDSLKFNSSYRFDIYGTFNAVGDEIVFSRNGTAEWRGLWCYSGSTVEIDSCTIEYAAYSSDGYGVYANSCTPTVSNALIQNCDNGIRGNSGIPILSGNTIQNNTTGVYVTGTSNPTINSTNTIQDNSTGIFFDSCSNTRKYPTRQF